MFILYKDGKCGLKCSVSGCLPGGYLRGRIVCNYIHINDILCSVYVPMLFVSNNLHVLLQPIQLMLFDGQSSVIIMEKTALRRTPVLPPRRSVSLLSFIHIFSKHGAIM